MPSRCAFESRPFLELPRPFLCAINYSYDGSLRSLTVRGSDSDLTHRQLRIVLSVTDGLPVLLLSLELENDDFVAATVTGDGGNNPRISDVRAHDEFSSVVRQGEDSAEFDFRTDLFVDGIYPYLIAGRHTVLPTTSLKNCIHKPLCYNIRRRLRRTYL